MDDAELKAALEAAELKTVKIEEAKKKFTFEKHQIFAALIGEIQANATRLQLKSSFLIKDHGRIEKLADDIWKTCSHLRLEFDTALYRENPQDYYDKLSKVYFPDKSTENDKK